VYGRSGRATRFVVVRWLTEAEDPARSARELVNAIESAHERRVDLGEENVP
jgi:hypothetical protein